MPNPPASPPAADAIRPAAADSVEAARRALAGAIRRGGDGARPLVDAATALGRAARRAGLPFDALLGIVGDAVRDADGPFAPEEDAVLLVAWRLAGRAYQTLPAPARGVPPAPPRAPAVLPNAAGLPAAGLPLRVGGEAA